MPSQYAHCARLTPHSSTVNVILTGEGAFDNVRKALRVVQEQLRNGGPEEQAFAEHLRTHLSIGFECLYTQPQGRIWG